MADKENKEISEPFDPNQANVTELKDFLRDKGYPISGVKSQLVKRAVGVLAIGTESVRSVAARDALSKKQRLVDKFITPLGEILPPPSCLRSGWTDNVVDLPPFSDNELYNYLVLNKQRTCDGASNDAKRQLKAKVFYEDRHVHSVEWHSIEDSSSHAYVRCKVIPSYPTQQKRVDYNVWVMTSKVTGKVHSAGCDCVAGEGESCNHVAALLYALVDIHNSKTNGLSSVTSAACKWKVPRKRKLTPKKSQDVHFKKVKIESSCERPSLKALFKENTSETTNMTIKPINTTRFAEKMRVINPHAVWLYSVNTENGPYNRFEETIEVPNTVNFMFRDSVDLKSAECRKEFSLHFETLQCTDTLCSKIEEQTRGQCENNKWTELRRGLITSSNFGLVVKRQDTTPPESAIKTVFGYTKFKAASTDWGKKHEAAARRHYKISMKNHPVAVKECGLIINPKYPHLGASPDGLLTCKCGDLSCGDGVLEIKCPYKYRLMYPMEAAKDKAFCCELVMGKVQLKHSHSYYYQIQGQMAICDRSYCDFFVWTLKGHTCERITFDRSFWEECLFKLNSFYLLYVLPEKFTERVKRGKPLNS